MLRKFPDVPTSVCFHDIFHVKIITFPVIIFCHAYSQGSIYIAFHSCSSLKIHIYNYTHQVCQGNDCINPSRFAEDQSISLNSFL